MNQQALHNDRLQRSAMTWILSFASMALGGMMYALWRPASLTMFFWFSTLGGEDVVTAMRDQAAPHSGALPPWVHMSLPQALWVFSGCLAIHALWRAPHARQEKCWMAVVLLLALLGELGQATGLVPGVFDFVDLAFIVAAFGTAQMIAASDVGNAARQTGAVS